MAMYGMESTATRNWLLAGLTAIIIAALAVGAAELGAQTSPFGLPLPRPRFELLLNEDDPSFSRGWFAVYHDKESGQEVVCHGSGIAMACWQTGRKW